jgi:glycosyltransferase involved in cell wall biosynthesis
MKLSILIPVFNEKPTLMEVVSRVRSSLANMGDRLSGHELIMVDDYSTDGTRELMTRELAGQKDIHLFFHDANKGKGAAIATAVSRATGDIILIQDADLEYDPAEYFRLLAPILSGQTHVVFGSRFITGTRPGTKFWHSWLNRGITLWCNFFAGLHLTDMETCYKVFRAPILKNMVIESSRFGIEPELASKVAKLRGVRILEVPISYQARTYVEGKKITWRDGISAMWWSIKFGPLTSFRRAYRLDPVPFLKEVAGSNH